MEREGRGSILSVSAKRVDSEPVIEMKLRMSYDPKLFLSLGDLVQQPCDISFNPAQEEIEGT